MINRVLELFIWPINDVGHTLFQDPILVINKSLQLLPH